MHRIFFEIPVMTLGAATIAGLVLAAGAGIEVPTQPVVLASRTVESTIDGQDVCLEAPVVGPSIQGSAGQARLCLDGADVHASLTVTSLPPGKMYSAVFGYQPPAVPCQETPCGETDLAVGSPHGLAHLIGGGVVPSSQTLELQYDLHQVQVLAGGRVTLMLMHPGNMAGPAAQAVFTIP